MSAIAPLVIIRIPFERPQSGGLRNPIPIQWSEQKEQSLWHELSASRASNTEVDWQNLSTRLECPLPYLLYRTQARYEEDLRRIHEVRPIIATVAVPRVSDDSRVHSPSLTRRGSAGANISDLPNVATNSYTSLRRTADKTISSWASSSHPHTPLSRPTALPADARLQPHQNVPVTSIGAFGTQITGLDLHRLHPRSRSRSRSPSTSGSGTSDGAEPNDGKTTKEEQETLTKRLRELGRMMMSGEGLGLGFARRTPTSFTPFPTRHTHVDPRMGNTSPTQGRPKSKVQLENSAPASDGTTRTNALSTAELARVSRFARDGLTSIPSPSESLSPGELHLTAGPAAQTARSGSGGGHSQSQNQSQSQSQSSQGSEASSFSDLTDASLSASALQDTVLSRPD